MVVKFTMWALAWLCWRDLHGCAYSVISFSTRYSHGCAWWSVGGIYMVVHIHTDGSLARGLDPPTNVFINIPRCPAIIIIAIIIIIIDRNHCDHQSHQNHLHSMMTAIIIIVMKPHKSDQALFIKLHHWRWSEAKPSLCSAWRQMVIWSGLINCTIGN